MKIAYVCEQDSSDINSWSGTNLFIKKALSSQGIEVYAIDQLVHPRSKFLRWKKLFYNVMGKRYQPMRDHELSKGFANLIEKQIQPNTDAILSPSSVLTAYLNNSIPTFFYTDATFAGMVDYYKEFQGLCRETLRDGHSLEKRAIQQAMAVFYSSDWAAQSALHTYGKPPESVHVIPFGANLSILPKPEEVTEFQKAKTFEQFRFLFVGTNFIRKGGRLVIETLDKLVAENFAVQLDMVGIEQLPTDFARPYIKLHGFVNKQTLDGQQLIHQLLKNSHFMFVPSEADCTPIVYAEANSYGLPVIARNTGGVPTMIRQDINGGLFESDVNEYVQFIKHYLTKPAAYQQLATSTYQFSKQVLNWDVAGKALVSTIAQAINKNKGIIS